MKRLIAIILILALSVPAAALAFDKGGTSEETVFGKWSVYFDLREYNKTALQPVDFDVQSLDLYIYENGACYISIFKIKDGAVVPDSILSGIWIGDEKDITMRFGEQVYKASIDYMGVMTLQTMTVAFKMIRVDAADPLTYFN